MTQVYLANLSLKVRQIDVKAQKIPGSTFQLFGIVIATFQVNKKLSPSRFFQEIFLMVDISIMRILEMLFLILSNANI